MPLTPQQLLDRLDALSIPYTLHRHPPLHTVEESRALRGSIPGLHTKNLFLRDKKEGVFLVSVEEDAVVDLKSIHTRLGASGRVSFGKPELLMDLLGVLPGSVTLFGPVNDTARRVTVVMDEALAAADVINCHPLTNEATVSIAPQDVARFLEASGHRPHVLKIVD